MSIFLMAAALAQAFPATARISAPDFDKVVARGQLLYALDQAAWHSTDAVLGKRKDAKALAEVRGWIVEPAAKGLRVTYYGLSAGQAVPFYTADVRNGKVVGTRLVPSAERQPLGVDQQRMVAARTNGDGLERCGPQPFNTVVIPPAPGAPVEVYYLTPQTRLDAWPVGKHYQVQMRADGSATAPRAFSKTCLQIGGPLPKGAKPVALFVNNVVDPYPTEIHVFTALASRVPLVVQTSTGRWWVDGRTIRADKGSGR